MIRIPNTKDILTHLYSAQNLIEEEFNCAEEDLKWEIEWNKEGYTTSNEYRRYLVLKRLTERMSKVINDVIETSKYSEWN